MSGKTKIEWAEKTWNPIAGCSKAGPGCRNCYAERRAHRLACIAMKKFPFPKYSAINKYASVINLVNKKWIGNVAFDDKELQKPISWKKTRRIFVNSMSDTFHEDVPIEWIGKILDTCTAAEQHEYLFLTKRINILTDYISYCYDSFLTTKAWLGISVCTQKAANRDIEKLLRLTAKVKYVSFEPMIEEIKVPDEIMKQLDWVIIGCESGPGRRIIPNKYLYNLAWQCKRLDVPVFLKQINRLYNSFGKSIIKTPEPDMMEYPKV